MASTTSEIQQLIDISRYYGRNTDYVIAGGGNTSWKDTDHIWVKASGTFLADITAEGFVVLNRSKLGRIRDHSFSEEPGLREQQVKDMLYDSCEDAGSPLRPSVETSLHDAIDYSFVVHLHPTLVNALMCSKQSVELTREWFPDALYVPYTDPGYTLFMKVLHDINAYRETHQADPRVIFLENHGVFVAGNSTEEIRETYKHIIDTLQTNVTQVIEISDLPIPPDITGYIPALRMIFSTAGLKTCVLRHSDLIARYYKSKASFEKVARPFTPDIIVYCKSDYLYIENSNSPQEIIESVKEQLPVFIGEHGYAPKMLLIKNVGLLAVDDSWSEARNCLDVFEDLMKIRFYSESFGGPRFMTDGQIRFIDNWEVEHYRRKVAKGSARAGKVAGKTAIVTGGALGFGAGIVRSLVEEGANVVIADINEEDGLALALRISKGRKNKAWLVPTDVSEPASIQRVILTAVKQFGGIDLLISNAGILHAGSIDEMDVDTFNMMTTVNYAAFFYCVKCVTPVMKLQQAHKKDHYSDIIQINSKSGLAGSNKNFAYAGGKFGGIGLTQSFALELMPYQIKVNAICPGNFFEGPLWSDPERGLFVQYLQAGKVPGATTIEEVKKHYESMVPAKRGCRVEDVTKAIYYLIEQEYETGQALPVTGGQIMLH